MKIKRIIALVFFITFALWSIPTSHSASPSSQQEAVIVSRDTGIDLQSTIVDAINRAKVSITLSIYSITDRKIISALRKQADLGVAVKVVCDSSESIEAIQRLGDKIKIVIRESGGLMHQKILVIDHDEVWIGSANMTHDSLCINRNLCMGFYAKEMALDLEKGIQTSPKSGSYMVDGQTVEMMMLPDQGKALNRLLELLKGARKTIRVAMFTWTHPKLTSELIAAQGRGVAVKAILDTRQVYAIKAKAVTDMVNAGLDVKLNKGGEMLHHKFAIIDSTLVMGSANWTKAAFEKNDEVLLIWHNLSPTQRGAMEQIWQAIDTSARDIRSTDLLPIK